MESLQVLKQSRDVFRELAAQGEDVRKEQAFVLKRLGALLLNIELTRAIPLLEKSLTLYQQLGDRWGQSEALFYLSCGRMRLKGYFDAKPLWEESIAIKRAEGDQRGLADSLAMLGIRAASHNQTADARQYAHECHDTYLRINDRISQAEAHWNLGVLMTWAGQYAESKEILTKADVLYGELGLHPPALIFGNTLAMLGEYDAVIEYVEKYMTGVGEAGFKPNEARAYTWLCYVALARKDYGEARQLSQKSIAAFEACGLKAYAGVGYALLALAARGEGEQASPWRYLEKGLRIQQDRNQLGPLGIWMTTPVTAVLLADAGLGQEAVTAYTFACNHPMIANSVWFDDVMGGVVRNAAAQLTPAVAEQARQEGQAAEPWQMGATLLRVVSNFAQQS
jgi:tetratricopeptide (TPR) repeat protein